MTKLKIEPCAFCGKVPRASFLSTTECVNARCPVIVRSTSFSRMTIDQWNRAMRRARRRAVREVSK